MPSHTKKTNGGRIPRPINCFMYFRLDKYREIASQSPQLNHRDISKVIAKWWREASNEEKAPYHAIAAHAKAEHKKRYPNYKYAPIKKSERKVRPYHRKEDPETIRRKAQASQEMVKQWLGEDQVDKEECNPSLASSFYFDHSQTFSYSNSISTNLPQSDAPPFHFDYPQTFSCDSSIGAGSPQFDALPFQFDDSTMISQPLPEQLQPTAYPSNNFFYDSLTMPFYPFVQPCTNICNLLDLDLSFML